MGISHLRKHLAAAEVLSAAELSRPDLEAPGALTKKLREKGRSATRKLTRYLQTQFEAGPLQDPDPTLAIAVGSVSRAPRSDRFLIDAIDQDQAVVVLWESRGGPLEAALASLVVLTSMRHLQEYIPPGPSGLVRKINRNLTDLAIPGSFISLSVAYADSSRGVVEFCCAGAPEPLVYRLEEEQVDTPDSDPGIPAGIERDSLYSTGYIVLKRHDWILFSTDGLWKAAARPGSPVLSPGRLRRRLRRLADRPAIDLLKALRREVRNHVLPRRAMDGAAVAIIKRQKRKK